MDEAYNAHSPHTRRHNKSSTSLNSLSLAPLTTRLPIDEPDFSSASQARPRSPKPISYIEHRHVGPNPGVLSHPNSRSNSRHSSHRKRISVPENKLGLGGKSKSSTQLHIPPLSKVKLQHHKHASGAVTPGPRPTHGHKHGHKSTISEDISLLFSPVTPGASRQEDDWLLRTGSLLTYGARETKGQAWLVSRASSTTVTGRIQDEDSGSDDEAEKEEAKWAHAEDRRGSATSDEFSPVTIRSFIPHNDSSKSASHSRYGSRAASRAASRNVSRRGSKVGLALTPRERAEISMTAEVEGEAEDYFSHEALPPALSEGEDSDAADELFIKRSVKTGTLGMGGFVERMMGWSLFTVDDDVEDNDDGNETEMEAEIEKHREEDRLHWKEVMEMQNREGANGLPAAPKTVDGGWVDAAWLLSVASKVLL